jgi:hypothetical protein
MRYHLVKKECEKKGDSKCVSFEIIKKKKKHEDEP